MSVGLRHVCIAGKGVHEPTALEQLLDHGARHSLITMIATACSAPCAECRSYLVFMIVSRMRDRYYIKLEFAACSPVRQAST
jgi:hypothetical protein